MRQCKILLLIDYRSMFYSSTKEVAGSMNVSKIKRLLESYGHTVWVEEYAYVDFKSSRYDGAYVLYQSSEDPGLKYKEYIEDILLGLQHKGAILVPDFYAFRAHHNKVFMEILRDCSKCSTLQNIQSRTFGTYEEFSVHSTSVDCPVVLKPSAGSRSRGVVLAKSQTRLHWLAKRISRTMSFSNIIYALRGLLRGTGYKAISEHRGKFIVQKYVEDLGHDYKILVYAERYYVLQRKNRPNDFRASGSGCFKFIEDPPIRILEYVEGVVRHFDTPFCSLDVAVADEQMYLLEFQFVSFGQYALENSTQFFIKEGTIWKTVYTKSDLEHTFTHAVHTFLANKGGGERA